MVTEFWPGWFDHWGEPHHQMEAEKVAQRVSNVLEAGASINLYMFHGNESHSQNPCRQNETSTVTVKRNINIALFILVAKV